MANELSVELCYEDIKAAMIKFGFYIEVSNAFSFISWITKIGSTVVIKDFVLMNLYLSCRWRRSPSKPLTQRTTALCSDTFMTVSSLLHGNSKTHTATIRTTNQLQSHNGYKVRTAWRDRNCLNHKRLKQLNWQNNKAKKVNGHFVLWFVV